MSTYLLRTPEGQPLAQSITRIRAKNFRSLANVDVQLAPMSVLVGPNGSGKSNLLKVLQFIATSARFDIEGALHQWGGWEHVHRQAEGAEAIEVVIEGQVTEHSSESAPDSYRLRVSRGTRANRITRVEEFNFKRLAGPGRKITVRNSKAIIEGEYGQSAEQLLASGNTSGLGTLSRLAPSEIGPGPGAFMSFLSTIRNLEPDVVEARRPARIAHAGLADDASNLADALLTLKSASPDSFDLLEDDLTRCLPGLKSIHLTPVGGPGSQLSIELEERGLTSRIALADASFGTVRLLALLTALHDPNPPAFTAIEEVDHGLHPYALDVLIDRMRAASERTQILAATHSPTLVNRLNPEEMVICDRDEETGESLIPARTPGEIAAALEGSEFGVGELWFAGAIGGVPE